MNCLFCKQHIVPTMIMHNTSVNSSCTQHPTTPPLPLGYYGAFAVNKFSVAHGSTLELLIKLTIKRDLSVAITKIKLL